MGAVQAERRNELKIVCERVNADDGRAFVGKLLDNVPAALIILLPLMALLLKILYPLSKRYYVEHLLFVVHFHAFIFLILTLQILFGRLTSVLSLSDAFAAITGFAVAIYIFVYFYKAMRPRLRTGSLPDDDQVPGARYGLYGGAFGHFRAGCPVRRLLDLSSLCRNAA